MSHQPVMLSAGTVMVRQASWYEQARHRSSRFGWRIISSHHKDEKLALVGSDATGMAAKKSGISSNHVNGGGVCQERRPMRTIHSPIGSRKQPLQIGSLRKASGGETV